MRRGSTQFLFVAVPKVLAGAGMIFTNMLLLRYFGADEFGILSMCMTFILMSDAIVGSALDMAVVKLAPVEESGRPDIIHKAALQIKLLFTAVLLSIVAIAAAPLAGFFFRDASRGALLVMSAVAACLLLLLRSAQAQMQTDGRFGLYGLVDILHFSCRFGGIGLLLAAGIHAPEWIVGAFAIAPLLPLTVWAFQVGRRLTALPGSSAASGLIVRTALWMGATFALGSVIARIDLFLLARWSTLDETGLFAAAQVFTLPVQLLGTYLGVVLSPRVSPLLAEGRFFEFYRRVQGGVVALCGISALVFLATWHYVAPWVLPAAYAKSFDVAYVLIPGAIAGLATFPVTLAFVMFVRPRFLIQMDCVTLPLLIGLNLWAIPEFGARGAAFVSTFASVARAATAQFLSWKWAREHDRSSVRNHTSSSTVVAVPAG